MLWCLPDPGEGVPCVLDDGWSDSGLTNLRGRPRRRGKSARGTRAGNMNTLHQALEQVTANLPALFLQKLIDRKLKEQHIEPPRGFSEKMAAHFMAGSPEPFTFDSRNLHEKHHAHLYPGRYRRDRKGDRGLLRHATADDPAGRCAEKRPRSVLKTLRERWPNEHALQEKDLNGFRDRLRERWGPAIGQLRMVLTMSREWCQEALKREEARNRTNPKR